MQHVLELAGPGWRLAAQQRPCPTVADQHNAIAKAGVIDSLRRRGSVLLPKRYTSTGVVTQIR